MSENTFNKLRTEQNSILQMHFIEGTLLRFYPNFPEIYS